MQITRLFALGLILVLPLAAQTVVGLRTGAGAGRVSNCTNATPIVCTTLAAHGFVDNDYVTVTGAIGNTAANGRHYVDVTSATTFELYAASGPTSARAGNGAWIAGGNMKLAGKIANYTLPSHPRVLTLGGSLEEYRIRCWTGCLTNIVVSGGTATANITAYDPRGKLSAGKTIGVWRSATSALNGAVTVTGVTATTITWTTAAGNGNYTDASISEYAYAGNPAWDGLVINDDGFESLYLTPEADISAERYHQAALRYYVTGHAASLPRAKQILLTPELITENTMACDESGPFCGRNSIDYGRLAMVQIGDIYTRLKADSQLSGGEITAIMEKFFPDPSVGDSCTNTPITSQAGTISVSGTAVTGVGTSFNSSQVVGGVIWIGSDRTTTYTITAIASATAMTLGKAGSASASAWSYSRPWQSGDCGFVSLIKHHPGAVLTDPTYHPTNAGTIFDGGGTAYQGNLPYTALVGYTHLGMSMADDDARAKRLLEDAWQFNHDMNLAYNLATTTDVSHIGEVYGSYRGGLAANSCWIVARNIAAYPSLNCGLFSQRIEGLMYVWNGVQSTSGNTMQFFPAGEGSSVATPTGYWHAVGNSTLLRGSSDAVKGYYRDFLSDWGYTSATAQQNSGKAGGYWFLSVDPQIAAVDRTILPLGRISTATNHAICQARGMTLFTCQEPLERYDVMVRRASWADTTRIMTYYGGTGTTDHWRAQRGGALDIMHGQDHLIGSNFADGAYAGGGVVIERETAFTNGDGQDPFDLHFGEAVFTNRPVSYFLRSRTDTAYSFALTEEKGQWDTPPTRAQTHLFDDGEFTVLYVDAAGAKAGSKYHTHYQQTSGTTYTSGKVTSQSASATILSRAFSPVTVRVAIDDSYGGRTTNSTRLSTCHSADAGATCNAAATVVETIQLHRFAAGTGDTALTGTALNPDANWTGVEATGASNRVTLMFSRGGVTRASMPAITTNGTGRVFVSGLDPGTYALNRNGVPVSGCEAIAVVSGDNTLTCASVAAGSITVGTQATPEGSLRGGAAIVGGAVVK